MRIRAACLCVLVASCVLAAPALAGEEVVVTGLVVDEGRHPQQGARVEVRFRDIVRTGETDAAGRYAVSLPWSAATPTAPVAVSARSADEDVTLGGWVRHYVDVRRAGPQRAPNIALRALIPDTLTLQDSDGRPAAGVELVLATGGRYGRADLLRLESGADGQVTLRMPPGHYALVVSDPRWASAERELSLPRGPDRYPTAGYDPQVLQLARSRSVRVRVLDDRSGAPLEGASVRQVKRSRGYDGAWASAPTVQTDAGGEAVLARLPVGASAHVGAWIAKPRAWVKVEITPDQDTVELRLVRAPTHTARWPLAGGPHRPPEGATLVFRPNRYEKEPDRPARVEDGHVVLDEYPETTDYGFAVHEERTAAWLRYELVKDDAGEATVLRSLPARFFPTSTVRVRLVDEQGAPVAGLRVLADGWFMIRDATGRLSRTSLGHGDATNAAGEVMWEGVFFEPCRLKLLRGQGRTVDRPLGEINPQPGTERTYEYVVPTPRTVEMHVTLDGKPGLRADIDVYCGGHLSGFEADALTGIIRFPYHPAQDGKSTYVAVNAAGYVSWSGSIEPTHEGELRFDVALRTSLTLSVALVPEPSEWVLGDVIQVHRFEPKKDRWVLQDDCGYTDGSFFSIDHVKAQGLPCWRALARLTAGTYRLVHVPTGLAAPSFKIDNSKPIWVTKYVLPTVRKVRGRFLTSTVIPWSDGLISNGVIEDLDAAPGLRWDSEDDDRSEFRTRGGVAKDGSFEIQVAAGTDVRLRLLHPLLEPCTFEVPATHDGPFQVRVTPKVILEIPCACERDRLADGVSVGSASGRLGFLSSLFRPPSWLMWGLSAEPSLEESPRIRLAEKAVDGKTTWRPLARTYNAATGAVHVGLPHAGRHTLFVDFDDRAPFLIRDLRVSSMGLALGPVPPPRGSRVHVTLLPSMDNEVLGVTVHAEPVEDEGPEWTRQTTREGRVPDRKPWVDRRLAPGAVTTLYGLRRGTFRLRISAERAHTALDGAPDVVERTVTVDGKKDLAITADFRTPAEQVSAAEKQAEAAKR